MKLPRLFYVATLAFLTAIKYNIDIEGNLMKRRLLADLSLQSSAFSYINCLLRKSVFNENRNPRPLGVVRVNWLCLKKHLRVMEYWSVGVLVNRV